MRKIVRENCCCLCILAMPAVFFVAGLVLCFLAFYFKGVVRELYENRPESKYIAGGRNESYMRKQGLFCLEMDIDYENFREYEQSSGLKFQPIDKLGFDIQVYYWFRHRKPDEYFVHIRNGFFCIDETTRRGETTTVYDSDNQRLYQRWVSPSD